MDWSTPGQQRRGIVLHRPARHELLQLLGRRPPGAASEGSQRWRIASAAAASLARADSLRTGEDLRLAPDTESKGL